MYISKLDTEWNAFGNTQFLANAIILPKKYKDINLFFYV